MADPRSFAVGSIRDTLAAHPHLTCALPAMGYGPQQIRDLEATLERAEADVVVIGTPVDLRRLLRLNKPAVRVTYAWEQRAGPPLEALVTARLTRGETPAEPEVDS